MKTTTLLLLSVFLFVIEALGDGRDIAATSICSARETEEAVSLLIAGSGWSEARWGAARKLLACHGGKFEQQKFLKKTDGTSSSSVTCRIDTLKANLSYEDKTYLWFSVDEDGITKDRSGQKPAK